MLSVLSTLLLTACVWKGEGLIQSTPLGPVVQTSTGARLRLVHGPDDAALDGLDGFRVLLEGQRVFRTLRVSDWEIPEGVHGMAVWVGRLERRGVQLGLSDHNSGAYYLLESSSWPDLQDAVGSWVAIEGYVDGPHRVVVLHHQVLVADPQ